MQSEDFDKKIKEAAEHHHPAYDEKAWTKMEKLLDKHLPQKERKKRRFLFFLLLFLIVGGSSWLLISKPWENKQAIAKSATGTTSSPVETAKENTGGSTTSNEKGTVVDTGNAVPVTADHQETAPVTTNNENRSPVTGVAEANTIKKTASTVTTSTSRKNEDQADISVLNAGKAKKTGKGKTTTQPSDEYENTITNAPVSKRVDKPVPVQSVPAGQPDIAVAKTGEPVSLPPVTPAEENKMAVTKPVAETKKEEAPVAVAKKEEPKKEKSKKKNEFFFSLSAGPDVSNVGNDKLGKMKLLAGAGFGYTFKERLTLRTGFYMGRKVYSAGPEEYHAPDYFYTLYPYLENVNADCKVYEIPLSVSYNFGNTGKQNWFAAAGISSFLMKEETYDYKYKYSPSGQSYNATWTILDKNKHYFSVATLSAGYRRNLGKNFFVMAEPYVKLPLGGVGFGKVKLNSGGVLFTVGIKPFAK